MHAFHPRLQTWLRLQTTLWLGALPALAWWIAAQGAGMVPFWCFGGLVLASHLALVRLLGAGRNLADRVTLGRGLLILIATGMLWQQTASPWPWILLCAGVAGDLVDGWCARRYGATAAGANLDMETDQATTLCLAMLYLGPRDLGAWVLLLPGLRYLYLLGLALRGIPAVDPKPRDGDNSRARLICALMMILLLSGLAPWMPEGLRVWPPALALGLLVYSFSSDFWFLLRRQDGDR